MHPEKECNDVLIRNLQWHSRLNHWLYAVIGSRAYYLSSNLTRKFTSMDRRQCMTEKGYFSDSCHCQNVTFPQQAGVELIWPIFQTDGVPLCWHKEHNCEETWQKKTTWMKLTMHFATLWHYCSDTWDPVKPLNSQSVQINVDITISYCSSLVKVMVNTSYNFCQNTADSTAFCNNVNCHLINLNSFQNH